MRVYRHLYCLLKYIKSSRLLQPGQRKQCSLFRHIIVNAQYGKRRKQSYDIPTTRVITESRCVELTKALKNIEIRDKKLETIHRIVVIRGFVFYATHYVVVIVCPLLSGKP